MEINVFYKIKKTFNNIIFLLIHVKKVHLP